MQTNILIGIITCDGKISLPTFHSIIPYFDIKDIKYTVMSVNSDKSDILKDYNNLFSIFINHTHFDYLLFLKDNRLIPINHFIEMIISNKDLISYTFNAVDQNLSRDKMEFIEKENIAFDSTLLSKSLAINISNYADRNGIYYSHDPNYVQGDTVSEKDKIYNVFNSNVLNYRFTSGYQAFCNIVKALNYQIYSYTKLNSIH